MSTTARRPRGGGFGIERLPRIAYGKGSYLYDESGKRYLDGSGGPAAFSVGHAHPEVNEAIMRQLERVACAYRYLYTSSALEELSAVLLQLCGGDFQQIIYSGSGSEAMESALKIALQYYSAVGLMRKRHFIARERSWHGNTLGVLSLSGFAQRRRAFEGSLLEVSFISAANEYRPPPDVGAEGLVPYLAAELERCIQQAGPETVAAFVFEPVVGAAGGVVPAPAGYALAMQAVCRKHDVLMIADEVMCGSGRTGTWRALEHDGIEPDIMAIAKGLAGGYIPLGATLCTGRVANPILEADGVFYTGHTFTGHTAACAAGLAVQRLIKREGLLERVRNKGASFRHELTGALSRFDEVGDVRGRGYFIGIEFVRSRATRQPFVRERGLSLDIGARAFAGGLICYPGSGNVDGALGDTIILAPPYNASDTELEEVRDKLIIAIEGALGAK